MKKTISSLKQPIRYIVGILITNAKMSSINVFKALYVIILQGRWAGYKDTNMLKSWSDHLTFSENILGLIKLRIENISQLI